LAEIAIIGTDLAELLGSAIALNLYVLGYLLSWDQLPFGDHGMDWRWPSRLFPRLPLFAGVLITAADVLLVLVFFRSNSGRQGMLLFEIVIVALVSLARLYFV